MSSNPRTGDRIVGSLRAADGMGVVRIEDRYPTDAGDLWNALTDPRRLARWYGEVDGDLRTAGRFRVHLDGAGVDANGTVQVCDPPQRLRVVTRETEESRLRGGGAPAFDQTIEATLHAEGEETVLVIEIRGLPLDKLAAYGAGWQIHAENLASHVDGREPDDPARRWGLLGPVYRELAAAV